MLDLNNSVKRFCRRTNFIWLVLLGTLIVVVIELLFSYLFIFLGLNHQTNLPILFPSNRLDQAFYLFFLIIKACILAPIIETLIFQFLLFEAIIIKFKANSGVFIFASAILFGICHFSSLTTVIVTSLVGIIFNYFYCVLRDINNKKSAYLVIASIHSLVNLCVFIDQIL